MYLSFSIRSAQWQASASAFCAFASATKSALRDDHRVGGREIGRERFECRGTAPF